MASDVRLICFDLGRVLVRICDNWQHASQVARLLIPLPQIDDSKRNALREAVYTTERGHTSLDEFCRDAAQVFGIDASHILAMSNIYIIDTYPGVPELIEQLNILGYETACLSNTNDTHWRQMADPKSPCHVPFDRLTHRFASHLIGHRKPAAEIYEHVERKTGFSSGQIVFFDDLPENIAGARERGWLAEQIIKSDDPIAQIRGHLLRLNVLTD